MYCEPVDDLDGFSAWGKSISLDVCAVDYIEILSTHSSISELYERVLKDILEEDMFFMRYFYSKQVFSNQSDLTRHKEAHMSAMKMEILK